MSMHQRGAREHDSIGKLFDYVGHLAKERVEISFATGQDFAYDPPCRVIISPTLFKTDSCQSSGKCCKVPFDLAYTSEGKARLQAAVGRSDAQGCLDRIRPVSCLINGRDVPVWVHFNDKKARYTDAKTCDFLENPQDGPFAGKFICGLHGGYNRPCDSAQPFHCIAPHFVVRRRGEAPSVTAFIGRMQFGRNWRFGCPVVFEEGMAYFDKDYQQDIDKLKMMQGLASDMGIKTWVPEMLDWMETNRSYIETMIQSGRLHPIDITEIHSGQEDARLW